MKGKVIGVATFQLIEGQNLNFAISSERISKLSQGKGRSLAEWETHEAEERFASAKELFFTGFSFLWSEDYENAILYFKKVVKENPKYAIAYFSIGYCNFKLSRYREALEAYK